MLSAKWQAICSGANVLTHKWLEMHGCVINTVATDGLVLMHQAIRIHSADQVPIVSDQLHRDILYLQWTTLKNEIAFW